MKKILLSVGLLLTGSYTFAMYNGINPTLLINGKSWSYATSHAELGNSVECTITVVSDTLVNGTNCKVVHEELISGNEITNADYILAECNGVVSLYNEESKTFDKVFDMNLNIGDTFRNLTVKSADYVIVNNTPLKRLSFDNGLQGETLMWLEGIGANYYDYLDPHENSYVFNQTAINGSYITDRSAYYNMTNYIESSCNLIDEEKVWEYFSSQEEADGTSYSLNRYKFSGTTTYNGKVYSNWILSDHTSWEVDKENNLVLEPSVETDNKQVALIRERDGYVYMLNNDRELNYCSYPYNRIYNIDDPSVEDVLLYAPLSFAEQSVDLYLGSYNYGNFLATSYIRDITDSYVKQMGILHTYRICNVPTIVEMSDDVNNTQNDISVVIDAKYTSGVGNIGYGNMTNIICDLRNSNGREEAVECFNNLYDKDGNVLYSGSNRSVPDPNGVDAIITDSDNAESAPMYDLMGRRISSPAKGQIYIQNGKKLIGK
jgi:hypothetical protein